MAYFSFVNWSWRNHESIASGQFSLMVNYKDILTCSICYADGNMILLNKWLLLCEHKKTIISIRNTVHNSWAYCYFCLNVLMGTCEVGKCFAKLSIKAGLAFILWDGQVVFIFVYSIIHSDLMPVITGFGLQFQTQWIHRYCLIQVDYFYHFLIAAFCILFMCWLFQDVVDGIEFARGGPKTPWGSVRAAMGHPEPFNLDYVSIGNQECWMLYYRGLSLSYIPTCITHQLAWFGMLIYQCFFCILVLNSIGSTFQSSYFDVFSVPFMFSYA